MKNATPAPFKNVQLSVKSDRKVQLTCDLSTLVDLAIPTDAWYGKDNAPIKSANICEIPAQRLRVEGMEDVFVDLRIYTKSNAYEARQIRAERDAAEAIAIAKLEAVRPEAEKLAAALGKTVDDVMKLLAAQQA